MTNLQSVCTALLTPFKNGKVDFNSFERLLQFQLQAGIKSFVVLGTTAENVLLTSKEKKQLLKFAVKKTKNKAIIIAGVGNPSTSKTIEDALQARKLGVDGLLVVAPYYVKATEEGIVEHFKRLKNATNLPIVAYNVRHRTGYDISTKVLKYLTENNIIAGLKEASNSLVRVKSVAKKCPELSILCGTDGKLFDYQNVSTAVGIVSVLSNCLPKISIDAFNKDTTACQIFSEFADILKCQISPVGAKYLAHKLNLIDTPEMRLPLTILDSQNQEKIDNLVEKYSQELKQSGLPL